ncbi:hypothetical protein ACWEVP_49625 [Amycolatopsis sp. NPDC003865]
MSGTLTRFGRLRMSGRAGESRIRASGSLGEVLAAYRGPAA